MSSDTSGNHPNSRWSPNTAKDGVPARVRWYVFELRDWSSVARATLKQIRGDNVTIVAAGVAFYAVLALIPITVMALTLYGFVTDSAEAEHQIEQILKVLPADTANIIANQMRPIASSASGVLSLAFAASAVGLLWTVSSATKALLRAVVIAYDEETQRKPFGVGGRLASLGLTLAVLVVFVVGLGIVAVIPAWLAIASTPLSGVALRWVALFSTVFVGSWLLYRFVPSRPPPPWGSLIPGAMFAGVTWVVASVGFSVYVEHFGSYNKTYGVLGGAVILMVWFLLSALAVIMGAEIDAELERHARVLSGDSNGPTDQ